MRKFSLLLGAALALAAGSMHAQTYTPIGINGFNHDVFAEAGSNAQAVTDTVLDATSHIMFTQGFAAANGISYGLPDNGTITNAANTYQFQLAAYDAPNALTLMRGVQRDLALQSPGSFAGLSLLIFSTENASTVTVTLNFSDGSSTTAVSNASITDWFFATGNVVTSGFGRITRLTAGPYSVDGAPNDPRFYHFDINLSCTDRQKTLSTITIKNTTSTGSNAPFPNTVVLAVSGKSFSQTVNTSSVAASCGSNNGSGTVTVSGSTGPYTVTWTSLTPNYTGPTATGLAAGSYPVTITDNGGCTSNTVVVVPGGGNVSATATANPATICSGASSQLSVTLSSGTISTVTWNPGALSGSPVTVSPGATTAYTATGTTNGGCPFTASVTVNVTPATPPAAPVVAGATTVCAGNSVTLSITGPNALYSYTWYSDASGGTALATGTTFTTPVLNSGATYYAQTDGPCSSSPRTAYSITVNAVPAAPAAAPATICAGGTATLTVQNPQSGITYSWYAAASGGTALATGTSYTSPVLNSNVTYYLEAANGTCTSPSRTAVPVTVNPVPAAPTAAGAAICAGQSASLSVQGPNAAYTYGWYAAASGGTALATGATFTTPALTTNTTYYVDAAASGCGSGRTAVAVTVNPVPATPAAAGSTICSGSTATLTVQNPVAGVTYSWFAAASGGTALATGNSFTTPALTATTTYYVEAGNGSCNSSTRGAVTVTVETAPANPVVPAATICSGSTATLSIQGPASGATYSWYAAASGGSALATGSSFTTPALSSTTTYYVSGASAAGCSSGNRTAVPVTVTSAPSAPAANGTTICPGSTATLNVQNPAAGVTYNWYSAPNAGTLLLTGASVTTPALNSATTYYLEAAIGSCINGRTPVTVDLFAALPAPVVTGNVTGTTASFSWNPVPGATGYEVSANGGGSWASPSSGVTGTTHVITGVNPGTAITLQVRALAANSCANSAPGSVTVGSTVNDVFVPNVFTPNSDGRNDELLVYGSSLRRIDLRVYDQWGNEVYRGTDKGKGWDGRYKGQAAPVGVYVFVLNAVLNDGTTVRKKGSVNLLR